MIYSFDGRVRYSETGENGLLTLPGILNYFQDCSTFQSEEVGLGLKVLKEWKRFWVLSAWQVIVERYPVVIRENSPSYWHSIFTIHSMQEADHSGRVSARQKPLYSLF